MKRLAFGGCLLSLVLVAMALSLHPPVASAAPSTGVFIPVTGRTDIEFDGARRLLYISAGSQVLRYNVDSGAFLPPWTITGANLKGMDLSPDGGTLAVADASTADSTPHVYLIDLATGLPLKIPFTRASGEGGTFSVAFGSDGRLLVTSSYEGSGWVPLRRYDPSNGTVTTLRSVDQDTMLAASSDRSVIAWVEPNSSNGPVGRYRVSDGNMATANTGAFNYDLAINGDGTRFVAPTYTKAFVYGADAAPLLQLPLVATGAAFRPGTNVVVFAMSGSTNLEAYDLDAGRVVGTRSVGRTFDWGGQLGFQEGRTKMSADGSLVFAIVDDGVWMGPTDFVTFSQDLPGRPIPASPFAQTWGSNGNVRSVSTVQLQAGDSFDATLDVPAAADLDLRLFPPTKKDMTDSVAPVAFSLRAGVGRDENIHYVAPVTATYYLVTDRVSGDGSSSTAYTITHGTPAELNDDIPGVPLVAPVTGAVDAQGDVWDVYATHAHRRESLSVTVTPDAGLDVDVMLFSGADGHVVFYPPTLTAAAGGLGAQETLFAPFSAETTCYVAVKARSGSGSYTLESAIATCPPVTSLSLSATAGNGTTPSNFTGTLSDDSGDPVPSASILLETSVDGIVWTPSPVVYTDQYGQFAATVPLTRTLYVRANYAGVANEYTSAISPVATALFTPVISWVRKPASSLTPSARFPVSASVALYGHSGVRCTGKFVFTHFEDGVWVTRKTVAATGSYKSSTHNMSFAGTGALSLAGQWSVTFQLDADSLHGSAASSARAMTVGKTSLSVSVSKTKVTAKKAVTVSGHLKNGANGTGIKGLKVRVESSFDAVNWTYVATAKSGKAGALRYVAHPRSRRYYRFNYVGSSKWIAKASAHSKIVHTVFTMSGNSPGVFTSKKIYISIGDSSYDYWIYGAGQVITLQGPGWSGSFVSHPGPVHQWGSYTVYEQEFAGYFSVSGSGHYKIKVVN